jgi:hypothetical protein
MVSADESRPETGPGPINSKAKPSRSKSSGKKTDKTTETTTEQRQRKPGQSKESQGKESQGRQVQKPEVTPDELLAATETMPEATEPMQQPVAAVETPEAAAETHEAAAEVVAGPATPARVSVRTITDAYDDYTRKSIAQTSSFFQQLAGSRSLDKALELQSQFARATFETFVDESRRIRELHRELAKQRLQSLEGLVMGKRAKR